MNSNSMLSKCIDLSIVMFQLVSCTWGYNAECITRFPYLIYYQTSLENLNWSVINKSFLYSELVYIYIYKYISL